MRKLLAIAWLAIGFGIFPAYAQPVLIQAPTAPAPPAISHAQAEALIHLLQDDKQRAAFIANLQAMLQAETALAPKPAAGLKLAPGSVGAELLSGASAALAAGSAELIGTVRAMAHLRQFGWWIGGLIHDAEERALLLDLLWRMAVVVSCGGAAQYVMQRGLQRWRLRLNQAGPDLAPTPAFVRALKPSAAMLLRRVPLVLLRWLLDILPLLGFAAVLYGLLATPFGSAQDVRVVLLGLGNAYLLVGLGMISAHALVSPDTPALRLLHMSDDAAHYITRWTVRLLAVGLFGYALDQIGLLLGMYQTLHQVLIRIIGLILHLMLLVITLQTRRRVARRLRAPQGARGAFATLRNWFASSWHIIAIFYNFAVWLILAFEVQDGFSLIWHDFLVALAITIAGRLAGILLHGAIDRALNFREETAARFPDLVDRAARYRPVAHALVNLLLVVAAIIAVLAAWHVPVLRALGAGGLGARVARALTQSMVIVVVAVLVWEAVNAALASHLARLESGAESGRAARLRTLQPMLRTVLLVVVFVFAALTVLNQIGVNTAPLLAGAGVVGIAVGFGSQKLVQDVITGLFLLLENAMQVGDSVSLASLSGTVETLSIRTIRLRASDGSVHVIPFSAVTTVTNQSRDFGYALIAVMAGYNAEPDRVSAITREIFQEMATEEPWRTVLLGDLQLWGVDEFQRFWWVLRGQIKTLPSQRWAVQREFNRRLKYRFDALAIDSPVTAPDRLYPDPPPPTSEVPA